MFPGFFFAICSQSTPGFQTRLSITYSAYELYLLSYYFINTLSHIKTKSPPQLKDTKYINRLAKAY